MPTVHNRALALATRGMLGGSLLAIATHGLLQVAEAVAPPVELPPPVAVGGSVSTFVDYRDDFRVATKLCDYRFVSGFTLLIDPASRAWLTVPPPLRGHFTSRFWTLRLVAESEVLLFDAQQDEEDLILAWAAKWIIDEDDPFA